MDKSFPYGICRICGADPPSNSFSALLLPSFIHLVQNHLNIKIVETDKCSQVVCNRCVNTVKEFGVLAEKAKSLQQTIEKYILFQHEENEARQIKVEEESMVLFSEDEEFSYSFGNTHAIPPDSVSPEYDCSSYTLASPSMNRLSRNSAASSLHPHSAKSSSDTKLSTWNAPVETYNSTLSRSLPSMSMTSSKKRSKRTKPGIHLLQKATVIDNQHEIAALESTPTSTPNLQIITKRNERKIFSTLTDSISTDVGEKFDSLYEPDTSDTLQNVLPNTETSNRHPVSAGTPYKMTRSFYPSISSKSTKETKTRSYLAKVGGPNTTAYPKKCSQITNILSRRATEPPESIIDVGTNVVANTQLTNFVPLPEMPAVDQQDNVSKMKTRNKRLSHQQFCPPKKHTKFYNLPCEMCK